MRDRRFVRIPLLIFALGVAVSLLLALQLERAAETRMQTRFDSLARETASRIEAKVSTQIGMLRGLSGFFASSTFVSGDEFARYADILDLPHNHPGILGVGYAINIPDPATIPREVARYGKLNHEPGFHYWPQGERAHRSMIVYIHPSNRATRLGLGYDGMSERARREGMLAAAASGRPTLSDRIRLFSGKNEAHRRGFIIYTPLYERMGADRGALTGWLFSVVRAEPLFADISSPDQQRDIVFSIHALHDETPLFANDEMAQSARYAKRVPIRIAGATWMLDIRSTRAFERNLQHGLPLTVGLAGIVISLLLALIVARRLRGIELVERLVEQRTAQLSESNERLRAESLSRETAESHLRQLQKMEAIGQLTGGIAHDFNNMLAVIIGSLDLARRHVGEPERVLRLIDHATEGARHAAGLTQRLLAFARRQTLVPEVIAPDQLVATMSDLIRRTLGERVRLEVAAAEDIWDIRVDPGQLESALLNLAINARDAMPEGGELIIETGNVQLDEAYCRDHPDATPGEHVLISVSDNGTGMPREVLEHAVEPFFSTKEVGKGSGLGLSQVFGFVRQSGGHMHIESEVGIGTSVHIYLPRNMTEAAPEAEAKAEAEAEAESARTPLPAESRNDLPHGRPEETILVVEDEPKVRMMTVDALRSLGYSVIQAPNGEEAMRLFELNPKVDLLFTDVVMPGMNGRELSDRALALQPDLRVLFTTGYTRTAIVHDGILDPGTDMLSKPFTLAQLATRIRAALDTPRQS